jgi:HAD superfamily hydrolase (TIGR01509 family)
MYLHIQLKKESRRIYKNMHNIQAIIFDMDGVVSDTQKLHSRVERAVLLEYGIDITEKEIVFLYAGTKDNTQFRTEFEKHGVTADFKEAAEKKLAMLEKIAEEEIIAIPGFMEFLDKVHTRFKLAVASGANTQFVDRVLSALKIRDKFDVFIGGDKVSHGKPNPELFLSAAKKLQVDPENCLVIEDAKNGIKAAKNAGMKCIGILTTHTRSQLNGADKIIKSFDELSIKDISSI